MGEIDPWDDVLEAITAGLVRMTGEGATGAVTAGEPDGCSARFSADRRRVSVEITGPGALLAALDDYRLVLLYNLSFQKIEQKSGPGFRKVLTLHEGFDWSEQMLREVALESLGLLRHVLGARTLAILANPREPVRTRSRFRRR